MPAPSLSPAAHPSVPAVRWRLRSALLVLLAAAGCSVPGPRHDGAAAEPLRRRAGALSWLQAGDARAPRLILVHGTPGSASGWADYLLEPPPGLEVVAIDRPGFGRSGPDGPVTSLAAQAAAVASLLPADGRPALLLRPRPRRARALRQASRRAQARLEVRAQSLGGPIVARVAAEHPQQVQALILLAASLDPAMEKIHPMQHVGAWAPVRWLLPSAIRHANAELMALEPELRALAPLLPAIQAPVFIVHGSADDLVPPANVPYMQARLGGARCVRTTMLEGLNHFLPWNSAPAVRAVIEQARAGAC